MKRYYLPAFVATALIILAMGVNSQSIRPSRPIELLNELRVTRNENAAFLQKQTEILAGLDHLADDAQQDRNMAAKGAKE